MQILKIKYLYPDEIDVTFVQILKIKYLHPDEIDVIFVQILKIKHLYPDEIDVRRYYARFECGPLMPLVTT